MAAAAGLPRPLTAGPMPIDQGPFTGPLQGQARQGERMTPPATRPGAARARAAIAARTLRTDRWWIPPLVTFVGLAAWVIYATVRVFMHKWYYVGQYHYLTPFYSPCLTDRCVAGSSEFGTPLPKFWLIPEGPVHLAFLLLFPLVL